MRTMHTHVNQNKHDKRDDKVYKKRALVYLNIYHLQYAMYKMHTHVFLPNTYNLLCFCNRISIMIPFIYNQNIVLLVCKYLQLIQVALRHESLREAFCVIQSHAYITYTATKQEAEQEAVDFVRHTLSSLIYTLNLAYQLPLIKYLLIYILNIIQKKSQCLLLQKDIKYNILQKISIIKSRINIIFAQMQVFNQELCNQFTQILLQEQSILKIILILLLIINNNIIFNIHYSQLQKQKNYVNQLQIQNKIG
eukprot:TRINITY_DN3784_c2_g2_i4.p5 TRINITY_DN3784_c2_g2~~TRINITY_DN3784_c2_g2_i4.p5  ORF type:complete len:251 (+),score=-15.78 TRINITY_DN3784_c2_g2_i4:938-1690(+)